MTPLRAPCLTLLAGPLVVIYSVGPTPTNQQGLRGDYVQWAQNGACNDSLKCLPFPIQIELFLLFYCLDVCLLPTGSEERGVAICILNAILLSL